MCVEYTDLNKTCPKDSSPLPSIDRRVDGASWNALLNFLDAYSGYNQIMMYPPDIVHTSFITNHANFCYRVMPFGLKNAGATYQRLMKPNLRDCSKVTLFGPSRIIHAPPPLELEDPSTCKVHTCCSSAEAGVSSATKFARHWAFRGLRLSYLMPNSDNSTDHAIIRPTSSGFLRICLIG
uniref:Transposon Ty3-I Gag-Pol polyprotein n=1 Tax=Cajanus cajan TaxID=3821 RepID=A0A151T2I6_CAJCA|nr:Transposon Ty3-I Gag-Pol polyprotein [Cajanus cajan]